MSKTFLRNIACAALGLSILILAVSVTAASKASNKISPALTQALLVQQATVEAVEKTKPSVVSIIVKEKVRTAGTTIITINPVTGETKTEERPGKEVFQEAARGSGIIIDRAGLLITNKHVINFKNALIKVFLSNGDIVDGYIVDLDPVNDLAILKINGGPYEAAILGDSDVIRVGESVIAIGYSLGRLENTVTSGIISGLGRVVTADIPGSSVIETISDTIQTDASINKGNSGGPLINLRGEVIGVNTAIERAAQGISYTIPINLAKPAIKSVLAEGKIKRARLGVRYAMITPEIREAKALSIKEGALLIEGPEGAPAIVPGGPAARAGLKPGDIITEVNNLPLTIIHSLQSAVSKFNPGQTIFLTIIRDGAKLKKAVILDSF